MNKTLIKKIVKRLLKFYKPVDQKLRYYPVYKKLSQRLHSKLITAKSTLNSTAQHYYNMYDSVQIEHGTVLLDSFWGRKIGCNPYALYRAMQKDLRSKNFSYIWVKNKGVAAPEDVQTAPNVRFVEYNSKEHAEALLQAEIIIANSNLPIYYAPRKGQRFYNPWHGIPLKTLGFNSDTRLVSVSNTQRNFNISSAIFTSGQYATAKIVKAYDAELGLSNVHEIGTPRIDLTLSANHTEVRAKLNLNDDKKIILFAPTWRGYVDQVSTEIDDQITACHALIKEFGDTHHILVSLHNYTKAKIGLVPGISHIHDNVDMNEILACVDVLISDYSSIIFDYMALDRPIVLFVPDRERYERERGLYIPLEAIPATLAYNLTELCSAVNNNIKPSTLDSYNNLCETLISNEDGKASDRALSIIFNDKKIHKDQSKKSILIYPGGLLANGITSSFLNLLSNIDYNLYDVFTLIDAHDVDNDDVKIEMFSRVDSRATLILRSGKTGYSTSEKAAYFRYISKDAEEKSGDQQIINNIMKREARRILGGNHFDIAIDFSGYSPFWSALISQTSSTKKVIFQHNDLWAEANNPHLNRNQSQLLKLFQNYRNYNAVVSVSKELEEVNTKNLSQYYHKDIQTFFARNSLDLNKIISLANTTDNPTLLTHPDFLKLDTDTIKFITIARLSPEKNQMRLIQAFAQVCATKHNAILIIVGYGPLEKELKAEAIRLGIEKRVHFTGRLSNPYSLLKKCDCFVLSSDYEGQPVVLLEAMTLGVYCISTDMPSTRTMLANGRGTICEKSSSSLSQAMINYCNSKPQSSSVDISLYNVAVMQEFYQAIGS